MFIKICERFALITLSMYVGHESTSAITVVRSSAIFVICPYLSRAKSSNHAAHSRQVSRWPVTQVWIPCLYSLTCKKWLQIILTSGRTVSISNFRKNFIKSITFWYDTCQLNLNLFPPKKWRVLYFMTGVLLRTCAELCSERRELLRAPVRLISEHIDAFLELIVRHGADVRRLQVSVGPARRRLYVNCTSSLLQGQGQTSRSRSDIKVKSIESSASHWYHCFGFLVTSPLGFKAKACSALFALQRRM